MKSFIILVILGFSVVSSAAVKRLKVLDVGIYGPNKGIVLIQLTVLAKSELKTYTIKTTQDELIKYNEGKDSFIFRAIEKIKESED